jgi:hypothetical protein
MVIIFFQSIGGAAGSAAEITEWDDRATTTAMIFVNVNRFMLIDFS